MQIVFAPSLVSEWHSLPAGVRQLPATQAELEAFEKSHGAIPAQYRAFLQQFGGGAVGSEWVDGIHQLARTHAKFAAEVALGGWSMSDAFVFGWDGAGNPMAIAQTGAVVMEDHNFGGVQRLAPSFGEWLAKAMGHAP
jgi:hypothetical protein